MDWSNVATSELFTALREASQQPRTPLRNAFNPYVANLRIRFGSNAMLYAGISRTATLCRRFSGSKQTQSSKDSEEVAVQGQMQHMV